MNRVGILFYSGFETGDLTGFYSSGNTPEVVSTGHPVRAGNYSMRAYLHRTESDIAYRTEVTVHEDDTELPGGSKDEFIFTIGNEYWIGFSIHVQADLVSDPPGNSEIVFQIHGTPDEGEDGMNPPLALRIDTIEEGGELVDYWRITRLWDPRSFSEGGPQYSSWYQMMLPMDDADIGGWTDWVFHIIFDYNNNDDGLLQVWRNGTQVLDVSGGNCFNDQEGPYPKFGVYKWPWLDETQTNSEWRLYYFDEFCIGDHTSSYGDVSPGAIEEYESTMLVLPQDVSIEQLIKALTKAYPQRRTFGFSHDDAGVLGGTAILYNVAVKERQEFIDWYAKRYPKVRVEFDNIEE